MSERDDFADPDPGPRQPLPILWLGVISVAVIWLTILAVRLLFTRVVIWE